jgi:hypothetical protein
MIAKYGMVIGQNSVLHRFIDVKYESIRKLSELDCSEAQEKMETRRNSCCRPNQRRHLSPPSGPYFSERKEIPSCGQPSN